MSTSPATEAVPQTAPKRGALLATFTLAIFTSAALLFVVQPMFAKIVLPRLGGSPQVWSVAMVFFQAALLAGYGYAHLLTRRAPGRTSVIIHVVVMLAACAFLPLHIAESWGRPPSSGVALWLIGLFTVSIGLPFFALAANAPLLQAWFARTDHPSAKDPYFLYASSNVGSFLALLSYPTLIEPFIRLHDQTMIWSVGFGVLILLIAGSGLLAGRWSIPDAALDTMDTEAAPVHWGDALAWVGLAAVPSGLLLAVTAHISTDIAAVPLLWVVPLALYLATFVIVFSRRPLIPHWLALAVQPFLIIVIVAVLIFDPVKHIVWQIAIHLTVFFVCALVCHGELARRRPPARNLTSFYMWMSAGGMIGGISAGLVAPYVFNWIAEYPILIALAVLCRPGLALPPRRIDQIVLFGAAAAAVAALVILRLRGIDVDTDVFNWTVAALLVVSVLFWRDPLPFAGIIAFVLIANHVLIEAPGTATVRSFFGVAKVSESYDGRFRVLSHGTTLHGGQRIRDDDGNPITSRPEPIRYYYDGSAIAQVLDAARANTGGPIRFAVIGLGTASLTCRAQSGDTVHYYEIDRAIVRIAREWFSFISACRPDLPITLGDARLTLADAPDGSYDAIVVDAFTSDAIPIHLLTREAMAIYKAKLAPHGIVAVHISNRHLELASVVAGIADANGMVMRLNDGDGIVENDPEYIFSATVAAVARTPDDLGPIGKSQDWTDAKPDPRQWVWTDDYSNIAGAMWRQLQE
jgi:hypothetical protein